MDDDFFKDYPAPSGGAPPSDGDVADYAPDDAGTNGGDMEPMSAIPVGDSHGPPPDDSAEPECAAVSEWRASFAKGLEEKVASERATKAERAERARQTLTTMHARWEESAKDAADRNRKEEMEFLRARDGVISRMSKKGEAPSWDIIPELVDMTGKYKEGARDTSRMRQVLMRMKTS